MVNYTDMRDRHAIKANINWLTICGFLLASASVYARDNIEVTTQTSDRGEYVMANMRVYFTPRYFLTIMDNTPTDCSWIDNCQGVDVHATDNDNIKYVHTKIDVPWPLSDRDMIVKTSTLYNQVENTLTLVIEDAHDYLPEKKGYVRMSNVNGRWELKPVINMLNETPSSSCFSMTYSGTASANGNIPEGFAMHFLNKSTYNTFANLDEISKEIRHKESELLKDEGTKNIDNEHSSVNNTNPFCLLAI